MPQNPTLPPRSARLLAAVGLAGASALALLPDVGWAVQAPAPPSAAVVPSPRWPFVAAAAKAPGTGQGGIGVVLEGRAGGVFAKQIVPGGAAHRAGVLAGDQFSKVDGWPVPADAKVPDVASHVRGAIGSRCAIEFRRGAAVVALSVERIPMERMFPPLSKAPLVARSAMALTASGGQHTLGIRFEADWLAGRLGTYQWALVPGEQPLGAPGAQSGTGVVTVDADGGIIQLADWKLELKSRGDGSVMVAASNLPVHEVAGDWLQVAPPWPSVVKPRTELTHKVSKWEGPAKLRMQVQAAGKPVANYRVTLRLTDAGGQTQETRTAQTDAGGGLVLGVPPGEYRAAALVASSAGAGRDAYFAFTLEPAAGSFTADAAIAATLVLAAKPPSPVQPLDWATDPRVGQGLPELAVQRWFGLDKAPASLVGKVLLIDVWATWCGPCRATAPQVYELHSRLGAKGLVVVAASIDKDEQALEDYVREMLPGGPAVAWVGTDAMETLDTESVPTFLVVDHTGRIRGVHKGMGWSLESAEAWLQTLLDEARPVQRK